MKHIFILFFCLFTLCSTVSAQQMIARPVPFFYELSSNEIWDFYQDREGYIWVATTNGLARYDGYRLESFRSAYTHPGLLTDNSITCIADNDLYVWVGTQKGMNLFHKKRNRFIPFPELQLQEKVITGIVIDKDGSAWIAAEKILYKFDEQGYLLQEYPVISVDNKQATHINSIYKDRYDSIWIVAGGGIFRFDRPTGSFVNYPPFGWSNNPFIMYQDREDNYWIGSWGEGLWQFFPDTKNQQYYKKHDIINKRTGVPDPIFFSIMQDDIFGYIWLLSHNELYALKLNENGYPEQIDIRNLLDPHMMFTRIFKDRDSNLWLSSYDRAYTIFFDETKIRNFPLLQIKEHLGWDANILNVCLDDNDIMWLIQDRYNRVCLYDLGKNVFSYDNPGIEGFVLMKKSHANPGIWSGHFGGRVRRLVNDNMKISVAEDIRLRDFTDYPGEIIQLEEDRQGNVWIHTTTSVWVKPANQQNIIALELPEITHILCDTDRTVWAITSGRQLYRLDCSRKEAGHTFISNITVLSSAEEIKHVCIDKEGCIWFICSSGRMYVSGKEKDTFENVQLEYKIADSSVLNLLADEENVWIITNKRVTQYNIYTGSLIDYSASGDNISVNVFRHKAVTPDREGGIFAGGHGGIVHITPGNNLLQNKVNHPFLITDVKTENKSLFFSGLSGTGRDSNTIDKIYLEANDRNIELFFSSHHYSLTPRSRIAYRLEGIDKDWIYVDYDKSSAFYNQLSKGSYRFLLKTEYENGKWTEGEVLLTIIKKPALYETWYAIVCYIFIFCVGAWVIFRSYLKRIEAQNNIRIKEEVNRLKLDYFTNISHEILTPLTIISCAVDNHEEDPSSRIKQTEILKSNVRKLKRLIQQALDFRKVDTGNLNLNVSFGNIQDFIENICQTGFSPLAESKHINLQTDICPEGLTGYLDFDKLDKILYNLLSNAFKYTPENKQIRVKVQTILKGEDSFVVIRIEDEGIGIAPQEINRIFDRFYSNKKGRGVESNGIGLALTKDIITLHHGTISVESKPGTGSCFTVELPIDKEFYAPDERTDEVIKDIEEDISAEPVVNGDGFTILLVDDNTELLYVIRKALEKKYHILTATHGNEAWDKINTYPIDMIICDVMMPDENGWELCKRIKSDVRFNHIPVLILTAKNGMDDRITSYESGADGYIAKPFEIKVLFARVDNLIASYQVRQDIFRKEEDISLEGLSYQPADKQFLQTLIDSIEQHLEEPEFDLEQFASEMTISKSTLYRKIKSITGLTPLELIRNIKMKRACMMLKSGTLTISEVAYAIGYNNPKYFSKCFKDEFGITPTEYQQQE